ncbi:MAG TPA: hypothetical protein VJR92_04060, partial [Gemmatimonadaceae bacterium]|nr:hypothetical protein [Gemmatimonadaceae bacterium]
MQRLSPLARNMSAPAQSRIEVVRVTPATADALAVFFRAAWGDNGTGDDVRRGLADAAAKNPVEPGADIPAVAFQRDGEVLGYLGTIPVKFWNGSTEIAAHWLKGFMVLPEHRNGPVGFAVLKELLRHVGLSGIMTVAPAARRLFGAVGYVDCGALPNYIAILRPARVAHRIDIAQLGLGLPSWMASIGRSAQRLGLASLAGSVAGAGLRGMRAARGSARGFVVDDTGALPRAEQ